jgi:hypothetical protein
MSATSANIHRPMGSGTSIAWMGWLLILAGVDIYTS